MKKIAIILFLGVFSISMNAQESAVQKDGAIFEFETEVIDYGKIEKNSDGKRVFKFKNVGNSPLMITKIKSACGCTVPKAPKDPIMPGETGEIPVTYATNRVGGFSKSITIISNAASPRKVLRIKGIVLKPASESVVEKQKTMVSKK